jgi:hypothetical protein
MGRTGVEGECHTSLAGEGEEIEWTCGESKLDSSKTKRELCINGLGGDRKGGGGGREAEG